MLPARVLHAPVTLRVCSLEIVADEVVDFLLARVRCAHADEVLPKRLIVGRFLAALYSQVAPFVVLLADVRVLLRELLECCHDSLLVDHARACECWLVFVDLDIAVGLDTRLLTTDGLSPGCMLRKRSISCRT